MGGGVGDGVALPGAAGGFADAEGFDDQGAVEESVVKFGIEAEGVVGVGECLRQFVRTLFGDGERVAGGGEVAPVGGVGRCLGRGGAEGVVRAADAVHDDGVR